MKKVILIIVCVLSLNCSEKSSKEKIIESFITEVILKENFEFEIWANYIDFPNKQSEEGKIIINDLIKQNIIRTNSIIKGKQYKIIRHFDLKKMGLSSNLKFNDYTKVYFLVCSDQIVNPFIVENDKIIAFFNGLTKQKRNSYPWILNKNNLIN